MQSTLAKTNWRTNSAIFFLGMCALLNLYATQPVLKQMAVSYSVSISAATLTISATTLGVAITAPFAGAISDRYGRRKIMLGAILAMAVATVLCLLSPNFVLLLLGRLIQGIATPFVFAVAVAYINETFATEDAVRLNSVYVAGTAFGGFSGRFFAGLFFDTFHTIASIFIPMVLILILAYLMTLRWLPQDTRFVASRSALASFTGIGAHLHDWRLLLTCFVGASLLFQQVATFTYGSLRLQEAPINLNTVAVGFVFIVFLVPTILTPLIGRLILKIGVTKTFMITCVLGIIGLAVALISNLWAMIFGLTCSCVSVFAGQSCALGFVSDHVHQNKSAAVGLYLMSYYLGGTFGGLVPEPAYAQFGWVSTILIIYVISILALFSAQLAWRNTKKD
ncbi:MFS transporter [Secundilactobacillus folii]|uniref:MFS transporter n=1 Tax=Secundilactobacillus folii TaxID=2678357 RepID=A0A7X3C178_9LACO|nr:MFS transporter [Secundilactobacillus folii]MTV81450.1 MFS transporter [Secundilactobacillus folii]